MTTNAERCKRYRKSQKRKRKLLSNEWFTPPKYIEAAQKVMGRIDCDPASCEKANSVVKATKYFSIKDDGLKQAWLGNVWLNPPYQREIMRKFANKLLQEIELGHVKSAILMVHSRCSSNPWFQQVASVSPCFCLPAKRILCWSPYAPDGFTPKGNKLGTPSGSILFYFGDKVKRFQTVFGKLGIVR